MCFKERANLCKWVGSFLLSADGSSVWEQRLGGALIPSGCTDFLSPHLAGLSEIGPWEPVYFVSPTEEQDGPSWHFFSYLSAADMHPVGGSWACPACSAELPCWIQCWWSCRRWGLGTSFPGRNHFFSPLSKGNVLSGKGWLIQGVG